MNNRFGKVRDLMLHEFTVVLRNELREADTNKFRQWQGNCCRQTAVIGCAILDILEPEYTWESWEGTFHDILNGKPIEYDHAWIYGEKGSEGVLVDLARAHKQCLFMKLPENKFPDIPGYEHQVEISRNKIPWRTLLDGIEYYTGESGTKLRDIVFQKLRLNLPVNNQGD